MPVAFARFALALTLATAAKRKMAHQQDLSLSLSLSDTTATTQAANEGIVDAYEWSAGGCGNIAQNPVNRGSQSHGTRVPTVHDGLKAATDSHVVVSDQQVAVKMNKKGRHSGSFKYTWKNSPPWGSYSFAYSTDGLTFTGLKEGYSTKDSNGNYGGCGYSNQITQPFGSPNSANTNFVVPAPTDEFLWFSIGYPGGAAQLIEIEWLQTTTTAYTNFGLGDCRDGGPHEGASYDHPTFWSCAGVTDEQSCRNKCNTMDACLAYNQRVSQSTCFLWGPDLPTTSDDCNVGVRDGGVPTTATGSGDASCWGKLTTTSTTQAQYAVGTAGSDNCPEGYDHVLNSTECRVDAVTFLGFHFYTADQSNVWRERPRGCFKWTGQSAYFSRDYGEAVDPAAQGSPICKVQTATTMTTSPTTTTTTTTTTMAIYSVGSCMPSGTYELNECCQPGYEIIQFGDDCRAAYDELLTTVPGKVAQWGGVDSWNGRPAGCWLQTADGRTFYNKQDLERLVGNNMQSGSEVICKKIATTTTTTGACSPFTTSDSCPSSTCTWNSDTSACEAMYSVGSCRPSGQYELNECCQSGYEIIRSQDDCKDAYEELLPTAPGQIAQWGGGNSWNSRPAGCFLQADNGQTFYNKQDVDVVVGTNMMSGSIVICKKATTASPSTTTTTTTTETATTTTTTTTTMATVTIEVVLVGDYSTVVGNNKTLFLERCSLKFNNTVRCVDVRPGSIVVALSSTGQTPEQANATVSSAKDDIQTNGLVLTGFGKLAVQESYTLKWAAHGDEAFNQSGEIQYEGPSGSEFYVGDFRTDGCISPSDALVGWVKEKTEYCFKSHGLSTLVARRTNSTDIVGVLNCCNNQGRLLEVSGSGTIKNFTSNGGQ